MVGRRDVKVATSRKNKRGEGKTRNTRGQPPTTDSGDRKCPCEKKRNKKEVEEGKVLKYGKY